MEEKPFGFGNAGVTTDRIASKAFDLIVTGLTGCPGESLFFWDRIVRCKQPEPSKNADQDQACQCPEKICPHAVSQPI